MANSNFSLSVLPNAVIRLGEVFGGKDTRYAAYANMRSELIKAINQRQTARFNDIFSNGRCIGTEVVFLKDCTAIGGYACETPPTGCDIATSTSITSNKKTVNPTCYFDELGEIDDNLCNNEFTAEELFTQTLAQLVNKMDIRMNRYAYAQLVANSYANQDPSTIGTVVGNYTTIDSSLWTPDVLVQLELEAQYNGLGNYMIFDARNLLFQKNNAQYRSLNANEANQQAQFNTWDSRLIFDNPFDSKVVTSRDSTFFVDMDMIAFINRTQYQSTTPVLEDHATNFHTFYVVSPRTGIRYDVEYQKACVGRDETTRRYYKHKFLVKFFGGIEFAPVQCDNVTGVMEYVKVA